jgi:hypothetical protein
MKWEAKLKRPFQFRSVERDAETDHQRVGSVVRAIDAAVDSARSEMEALRVRVNTARDLAAIVAGTGNDEFLTRDPKDTSRLKEFEEQMTIGETRLRVLEQQVASLAALQELSRRCFPTPVRMSKQPG